MGLEESAIVNSLEIELLGGLGNQLFGYATIFAVAQRANLDFVLDISHLEHRGFQLQTLGVVAPTKNRKSQPKTNSSLKRLFNKVFTSDSTSPQIVLVENEKEVDDRVFLVDSPGLLRGYFQSWKYFDDYRDQIRSSINLDFEIDSVGQRILESFQGEKWVAVHIRRGDYLELQDIYPLTSGKYYERAKRIMETENEKYKFVVFTDDENEAERVFPDYHLMVGPRMLSAAPELLKLMSRADGIIGSNSSLSWWASYLNKTNAKTFIFPRPWALKNHKELSDLLCPNWISVGI